MSPISSFADDPSEAGRELLPCLERAKDAVPKHKLAMTPVFLGATAGMRLLRYACWLVCPSYMSRLLSCTMATQ